MPWKFQQTVRLASIHSSWLNNARLSGRLILTKISMMSISTSPSETTVRMGSTRTVRETANWSSLHVSYGLVSLAAQPRIDEATLLAVQQQVVQQAALAQVPDAVKRVRTTSTI